jgi:shikimate dehydrogenase
MNIVLTGLRGTGKTTMAKLLSKKLDMPFIDTDREIEKEVGMKIHKMVSEHGWDYFRDLEHDMCKKCSKLHNHIISTGGGALSYERNNKLFIRSSIIVWLKMHMHHMVRITTNVKKRPRLTGAETLQEEIETLVKERYPIFESIADIKLHVKNPRTLKANSDKLIKLLQRLCVPIIAKDTSEAKHKMDEAYRNGALYTELRLDLCGKLDLRKLDLRRTVLTPRDQKFSSDIKPAFVDLEEDVLNKNIVQYVKSTGAKLIASYHNFKETPSKKDLLATVKRLMDKGADVVKIATKINRYKDGRTLLDIASKQDIVVGIGLKSQPVRVLAREQGSLLTFAARNKEECSAEGQLPLGEHLMHRMITHQTKMFGIIGNPVIQSLGPPFHNTLFKKYDYDGVYLRLFCDDLKQDFADLKELGLEGASVTSPYKLEIIPLLDDVDKVAKKIQAVNTIVTRGNEKIGYNTDWVGAYETLKERSIKDKDVLILGYGGASRAVIYALEKLGMKNITILRRKLCGDEPKSYEFDTLVNFSKHDYDMVINCTPIDNPVDFKYLKKNKIAFDLRYTPSRFLDAAEKKGNKILNGLPMMIHQGLEQFHLWTGKKAGIKDVAHVFPTFNA